ncbi:MAG: T9SS type A sorting domain-containing protein, partial [Bacteroidetes bacterium]|nr:T9SS type A sorting domain-containing protein [Bacteroidota bacterium]
LYPVPSRDIVYLRTSHIADDYQITNTQGHRVQSGVFTPADGALELRITQLPPGFYYLHWNDHQGRAHHKKFFKAD